MNKEIENTLQAILPKLKKEYKDSVKTQLGKMIESLGEELKGVANSWTWARIYNGMVVGNIMRIKKEGQFVDGVVLINEERLEKNASRYAKDVVKKWTAKIEEKLDGATNIKVSDLQSCSFRIHAEKNGMNVMLEQDIVYKYSSRGTLFNQFPCRIYVDGKFTSFAKYKKM